MNLLDPLVRTVQLKTRRWIAIISSLRILLSRLRIRYLLENRNRCKSARRRIAPGILTTAALPMMVSACSVHSTLTVASRCLNLRSHSNRTKITRHCNMGQLLRDILIQYSTTRWPIRCLWTILEASNLAVLSISSTHSTSQDRQNLVVASAIITTCNPRSPLSMEVATELTNNIMQEELRAIIQATRRIRRDHSLANNRTSRSTIRAIVVKLVPSGLTSIAIIA